MAPRDSFVLGTERYSIYTRSQVCCIGTQLFLTVLVLWGATVNRTYRRHKNLPGTYFTIFPNNIWSYLLWCPVIVVFACYSYYGEPWLIGPNIVGKNGIIYRFLCIPLVLLIMVPRNSILTSRVAVTYVFTITGDLE